jgi:hypothetical protein
MLVVQGAVVLRLGLMLQWARGAQKALCQKRHHERADKGDTRSIDHHHHLSLSSWQSIRMS